MATPKELDRIVDKVLAYKPTPKSAPATKKSVPDHLKKAVDWSSSF